MLAWVAPDLREAHVEKKPTDTGVSKHRVKHSAAFRIAVPAFIDILANDAPGERGTVTVCLVPSAGERICIARCIPRCRAVRTRQDRASPRNQGPSLATLQCRKSVRRSSLA